MKLRFSALRLPALVLIAGSVLPAILSAQSDIGRARIALFEPAGQKADATLAAVLSTVADSVELSLACMDRYDVRRLASADPSRELPKIRGYCAENRIDQAICGTGSARAGGGYFFRLQVYDRRTDSITISREGTSTGALDMFDVTDTLVASLLDGLSGTHLLFGSLSVQTEPPGATVSVNGKDVGPAPVALRGLPIGALRIIARSDGREEVATSVTITDGETADASLTLARSMGKLAVEMPDDADLRVVSNEIGEKVIAGHGATELPTGEYKATARCPGLDPVQRTIAIKRNETEAWTPWLPGSLEVTTTLPGASIKLDKGDSGRTPHLFEAVPAGMHTIQIDDLLLDHRYYTCDGPVTVDVKPGERSALSISLRPGKAKMTISNAPKGSVVTLDGQKIDVDKASAEGVDIPAGAFEIEATSPSQQKWTSNWAAHSGGVCNLDFRYMTVCYLPRRTITIDAKTDDWAGIVPVLSPASNYDVFPNQPGTQITQVFACRDERTLYFRVDFADGTPTKNLSKDVTDQLRYILRVSVKDNKTINLDLGFDRKTGPWTALGILDEETQTWKKPTPINQSVSYRAENGTLEIAVPFAGYEKFVGNDPCRMDACVVSSSSYGRWGKSTSSGDRLVSFGP